MQKEIRRLKSLLGMQGWTVRVAPVSQEVIDEEMGPGYQAYCEAEAGPQRAYIAHDKNQSAEGMRHAIAHEMVHALAVELGVTPSRGAEMYAVPGYIMENFIDRVAAALTKEGV